MKENAARRPRFQRVGNFPTLRLTERDRVIFSAVSRFRFLTTSQIHSLVLGSRQNITRRLQSLYHAGYLDRPKAQRALQYSGELRECVHSTTRKSAGFLGRRVREKGRHVSSLFLSHALAISEVLVGIASGCEREQISFSLGEEIFALPGMNQEPRRMQWQATLKTKKGSMRVGVIPDAAVALQNREGRLRFYLLEVDRGTMPISRKGLHQSSIRRKLLAYLHTRREQALKHRFGMAGFQVLFVTHAEARQERMMELCDEITRGRFSSLFLFTTLEEVKRGDPIADITWKSCSGVITRLGSA